MASKNKAKVLSLIAYTSEEGNYVGSDAQVDAKLATQGKNTDFITVRVANESMAVANGGMLVKTKRTSRLTLPADLIEDLKVGMDINTLLDDWGLEAMRIIVQESFEPFYEGQSAKINPATHPTAPGETVLVNGKEIYYQTKCVAWGSTERDSRIVAGVEVEELAPAEQN